VKRRLARGLPVALILTLGCGRRSLLPENVPLDRVNCARCGMLVSEAASAAEVVFDGADTRFYDDPGCVATDRIPDGRPYEIWVRADEGKAWKKSGEAFFARPRDARTPMGYGFFAFSSREAARGADRDGKAWSWDELKSHVSGAFGKPAGGNS
jgi:hypothetical protein